MTRHKILPILSVLTGLAAAPVLAQGYSAPGQSWSGSWGFQSPSDRSISLQQAQAIRAARNPAGPSTVITNHTFNDNRSSYQEIVGTEGSLGEVQFHIGDAIGQNTNAVGAMNTGETYIEVVGSGNTVSATNSADSLGCIDGSVQSEEIAPGQFAGTTGNISPGFSTGGRSTSCASQ